MVRAKKPRRASGRRKPPGKAASARRFVGRDPSPVLDKYPPKPSPLGVPPPLRPSVITSAVPPQGGVPGPGAAGGGGAPPEGLIRLDRPFDPDDFSQMLGETAIRVTVPSDALPEVLRRVLDFMGFGIYVYAISDRPAPSELLKGYVVELQRVEYDPDGNTWKPFVEKGAASTPGGP